jgi:hypothetical protein
MSHPSSSQATSEKAFRFIDLKPRPDPLQDLRPLYQFVDDGEKMLSELHAELLSVKPIPLGEQTLRSFAGRFAALSRGADVWGFDNIYRIAFKVQMLLVDLSSGVRPWDAGVARGLENVVEVLARLLSECEKEYRQRIEVAILLESLSEPA